MSLLSFDPREAPQYRTPQYIQFRQQLAASEQLHALASMLRHVTMLFDGNLREPGPAIEPRYLNAAAMAIRYTSEESRISAERGMEEYAVARFDELEDRLRSCDCDKATRRSLIIEHIRNANSVYLNRLKNGPVRSALEEAEYDRREALDVQE